MASRREFLKGTAAGIGGVAALTGLGAELAASAPAAWDEVFDVVVIGSGASGMPAAIAAADRGASVMVIEKNWDVGGRAIVSGGQVQLGCGNRVQKERGVDDSPDQFFLDYTGSEGETPAGVDPKVYGPGGNPLAKHNDREIVRAFADNAVATMDFLIENGVEFTGLGGTRGPGDPQIPRIASVKVWPNRAEHIIDDTRGTGLIRPLEKSARAKGVKFLLLHRMTRVHRQGSNAGPVIGITAEEVDRWNKPTGRTTNIRARRGVIICCGGPSANVNVRRIYDPRLTDEYGVWASAWTTKDGDGELAALAVGASLWTACNQVNLGDRQVDRAGGARVGTRQNGNPPIPPDSPVFFRQGATGLAILDWQNAIMVKENGRRFSEETMRHKPMGSLGWREHIDAALRWTGNPHKLNGGGPIWAILDAAAVKRERWNTEPPYVDRAGGFFFSADTLEELAAQLTRCPYQTWAMSGTVLRETVERYNTFVDTGVDADFGKPTPTRKIETPPFYAAWATPTLHDVYSGIRINTNGQVIDLNGQVIPGLYAAGENASGMAQHGLAKSILFGRLSGIHAAANVTTDPTIG
jgi:urocanate reductase